ncbi:MAG: ornithine cyclodeaminase family protein [Acidobacteria bacterium]|nr:MAG: ornithine cyclodeaminase family protein [Acidobacteriota bacterium]REJ98978.1 MAG: ornithine cyclodeaminase family protein [Acidobacteriota bacterium]REK16302.1 MAG: ornithine cyclodeaminase family protein [Acidobacteriota bacterium]REK43983.1 MAG: ornithine cyclodeaminase family protein [Acidobacteriota bacterium]
MTAEETRTLLLSHSDVREILGSVGIDEFMDSLIASLEAALRSFDPETTDIPVRSGFHYDVPAKGLVEWMPVHDAGECVTIKVVGYHPSNPEARNLPSIISTMSEYDVQTGHLRALMDGTVATAMRTGAASALATRILTDDRASILGLIGCGMQSVSQLHAICRVRHIEEVMFFDLDPRTEGSFIRRVSSLGIEAGMRSASIDEILERSDILCTATSIEIGAGPLFEAREVKPGLHINAVGSDFPGKTEIPVDLLRSSYVFPDFRGQALIEGECQQLDDEDIAADLTELVGRPEDFEGARKGISVFDSTGWALEDEVAMRLFRDHARILGIGKYLEIESLESDPKNPYDLIAKHLSADGMPEDKGIDSIAA